jgi:hypothetical protein
VLIRTCEYVDNRGTDSPEAVLTDFADTLARLGAFVGGGHSSGGLVLGPEHAQLFGRYGYSRADVQQWLFDHAVRDRADLVAAGKGGEGEGGAAGGGRSPVTDPALAGTPFPMMPSATDIPILVAGAANAAISMVFRPFGWAPWSGRSVPVAWSPAFAEVTHGG